MTLKQAIKDPSWLLERMSNQKVEGNDGPGFRHVDCPEMLWEELVRLVEGLKVEEGQQPSKRQIVFNWLMNEDLTKPDGYWGGTEEVERVDALLIALAAQHLKREQERVIQCPNCGETAQVKNFNAGNEIDPASAAQPPQELVSLREALQSVIDERDTELDMMHCPYTNGTREHDAWHQGVREAWERFDVVKRKARRAAQEPK